MEEISFKVLFEKLKYIFTPDTITILILLLILIRNIVSDYILVFIEFVLGIEKYNDENKSREKIKKPISALILFNSLGWLAGIWIKNPETLKTIQNIIKVISIFLSANVISGIIQPEGPILQKLAEKNIVNKNLLMNQFFTTMIRAFVYIVAIFMSITALGYNINGLVAGLGIGSAIIALAVQDVVKNIIAGAAIISEKPFIIGDFIEIGTDSGTVEDITLRSTRIRQLNNSVMNIPNSRVTTEAVTNYSAIDSRRVELTLPLEVEIPTEKLERVISKIRMVLKNNPKVLSRTVMVTFRNITSNANEIFIYCYITESKFAKYLEVNEKINLDIIKVLDSENVSIGYSRVRNIVETRKSFLNNREIKNTKYSQNLKSEIESNGMEEGFDNSNLNEETINIRND